MSKKSRRRNRRLALLGALGAGLMLAGRGRGTVAANVDSGRGSGLRPTVDNMPKGIDKVISIETDKKRIKKIAYTAKAVINSEELLFKCSE